MSASKMIEKVIYSLVEHFVEPSYNQFGFKNGHSTDPCSYALKETINYYYSLNKLFYKMIKRDVPRYTVVLLCYWYTTQ